MHAWHPIALCARCASWPRVAAILFACAGLAVAARGKDAGALTAGFEKAIYPFRDLRSQAALSNDDAKYLGIRGEDGFRLSDVGSRLIVLAFLNRHCSGCRGSVPFLCEAFRDIARSADLAGQVRMLAIAVGNRAPDAVAFRKEWQIPFPMVPDPRFELLKAAAVSDETPFIVLVRRSGSELIMTSLHRGDFAAPDLLLREVRSVLSLPWDALRDMARGRPMPALPGPPKVPVTPKKLRELIADALESPGGRLVRWKILGVPDAQGVVEATLAVRGKMVTRYARVVSRRPVCNVCHDIHFIYVFDPSGLILAFEPIQLPKVSNKRFNWLDVRKLRRRVVGRRLGDPFDFNPDVDAVSRATITCSVVFDALRDGRRVFAAVTHAGAPPKQ